ncbi:MAG TPA: diguanylate cyclase, partial [Rectinemataceae bacterium]|nr:diguanylate cyclase [Rectinemataceae bacterium]
YNMSDMPLPQIGEVFSNSQVNAILAENGFTVIDFISQKVQLSETLKKIGVKKEDFLVRFSPEKIHGDDYQNFELLYEKLDKGDAKRGKGQFRFTTPKGIVWLALSFHVIARDKDGKITFLVLHDEDITELINAQEEIHERLVEIESLKSLLFAINKSLDFDETITKIIEHLHRIIPFDRASVQSLENGFLSVIGSFGYPEISLSDLRFPVRGIDNPSARAIASRRPIVCNDVEHDFEGFVQIEGSLEIKSWLGIPLIYEGRAIGLFALDSAQPNFYSDHHVRLASNVAEHIAIAVEHARQHTIVKEEARTDTLTGVANRYGLETDGQEIFSKAERDEKPLGVLMIDIDYFKKVNDTFGHAYGDQVLRILASEIQQSLRTKDYLVRYGGEEFVILLPATSTREALVVAERLREKVPLIDVDGQRTCPTVSIGVFSGVPGVEDLLHEFIHRADLALYEAKEAGRNRCRVWTPKPEYFDRQADS